VVPLLHLHFVPRWLMYLAVVQVMFHAPWCGQCKKLKPFWNKIPGMADSFKVSIAKLDATKENKISNKYDIKAYPTLKIIGLTALGAEIAVPFGLKQLKGNGKEDEQLANFANKAAGNLEKAKAEYDAAEAHTAAMEQKAIDDQEAEAAKNDENDVKRMTKKNWEGDRKKYTTGKQQFFVKFYLPTCKTCIELSPRFAAVARAANDNPNIVLGMFLRCS
jgi:thiol-disulfide isomerase/thioredoxin